MNPDADTPPRKSWLRRLRIPFGLVAGVFVLSQVARLDPGYAERQRQAEQIKQAREAERLRVAALMPEAHAAAAGTRAIDFDDLAFTAPGADYSTNSTGYAAYAPEKVKRLDGQTVRLKGFMLPTKMENGRASECLILVNQMACCYGKMPTFCEFVIARMAKNPAAVLQDQPLVFTGRLHVGDVFADKAWTAFYTLDVDEVGR